jgi:hypothetical protein
MVHIHIYDCVSEGSVRSLQCPEIEQQCVSLCKYRLLHEFSFFTYCLIWMKWLEVTFFMRVLPTDCSPKLSNPIRVCNIINVLSVLPDQTDCTWGSCVFLLRAELKTVQLLCAMLFTNTTERHMLRSSSQEVPSLWLLAFSGSQYTVAKTLEMEQQSD